MTGMRGLRIAFLLVLGLIGLIPRTETQTPSGTSASEGVPRRARLVSPIEELADRLRLQGKDPRQFLFWEGYPLNVARKESIDSRGTPFDIVLLLPAFEFIPGDDVERYVLLDEAGGVQDVATVCWPSSRRLEIACARCAGDLRKASWKSAIRGFTSGRTPCQSPTSNLGSNRVIRRRSTSPGPELPAWGRCGLQADISTLSVRQTRRALRQLRHRRIHLTPEVLRNITASRDQREVSVYEGLSREIRLTEARRDHFAGRLIGLPGPA